MKWNSSNSNGWVGLTHCLMLGGIRVAQAHYDAMTSKSSQTKYLALVFLPGLHAKQKQRNFSTLEDAKAHCEMLCKSWLERAGVMETPESGTEEQVS